MADAKTAIAITIDADHEGGFQKNPKDWANWTGGEIGSGELVGTKYGITALDLPGYDIESLTPEQATIYYREHYWKSLYSQIECQEVANKLFDMGVLFGVATAVKCLQSVLAIPADGIFGSRTLASVNTASEKTLLEEYEDELSAHAKAIAASKPNEAEDLDGWLRRIKS